MDDKDDILRTGGQGNFRMRADILALMLKGAGYAMIFCLVIWFALAVLQQIGKLLPEDSRFRPDPTPYSFILTAPTAEQVT